MSMPISWPLYPSTTSLSLLITSQYFLYNSLFHILDPFKYAYSLTFSCSYSHSYSKSLIKLLFLPKAIVKMHNRILSSCYTWSLPPILHPILIVKFSHEFCPNSLTLYYSPPLFLYSSFQYSTSALLYPLWFPKLLIYTLISQNAHPSTYSGILIHSNILTSNYFPPQRKYSNPHLFLFIPT